MISDNHAIYFDINKCFVLDGISLCFTKVAIAESRPHELLQRSTHQSLSSSPNSEPRHLWIFRTKIEYKLTYFKCAPNFSLWEWTCHETKMAEQYCWTIMQAAVQSGCGWLRKLPVCWVLEWRLDSHLSDHMCVYSFRTWAKFDFRRTFPNLTTAQVGESL